MLLGALLSIVEESGVTVLTLIEGLELADLLRSRLTRQEVTRQLRCIGESLDSLPPAERARVPELDWAGWAGVLRSLAGGGEPADEALWFASRSLVPATVMWLRVYRHNRPELFEFRPAEPA